MKKITVFVLVIMQLQSCMLFVPKVAQDSHLACPTTTKKLELGVDDMSAAEACPDKACLALFLVGVAGSLVVSGSIIAINNAIHWAEYTDTCPVFEKPARQKEKVCVQECDLDKQECTCIN